MSFRKSLILGFTPLEIFSKKSLVFHWHHKNLIYFKELDKRFLTGFTPLEIFSEKRLIFPRHLRNLISSEDLDRRFLTGFTLIELLVVVSLIGILSAIGLASYINFNRNQLVIQSTRRIVQDLRLAQSLASSNQKPSSDCGTLNSYIFKRIDETKYGIVVECLNPPDPPKQTTIKSGSIPSGILMSGFDQVKFKVLRQGIESVGVGNSSLMISGFGKSKKIIVEEGGVIKIEGE